MGKEKATLRWLILRVCPVFIGGHHRTIVAHVIVRHEQLTGLPVSAASGLGVSEFIGGNHVAQRE